MRNTEYIAKSNTSFAYGDRVCLQNSIVIPKEMSRIGGAEAENTIEINANSTGTVSYSSEASGPGSVFVLFDGLMKEGGFWIPMSKLCKI